MAAHIIKRRVPPFSLRLSPEERKALKEAANGLPLGTYVRSRLFGPLPEPVQVGRAATNGEFQLLAKLLTELGRSRLSSNVNQLAKAANTGTLPVGPETEAELRSACSDIAVMRAELLTALGTSKGLRR